MREAGGNGWEGYGERGAEGKTQQGRNAGAEQPGREATGRQTGVHRDLGGQVRSGSGSGQGGGQGEASGLAAPAMVRGQDK